MSFFAQPRKSFLDDFSFVCQADTLCGCDHPRGTTLHESLAEDELFARTYVKKSKLGRWLAARNLQDYETGLVKLGIKKIADLSFLTEDDMTKLGADHLARKHFSITVVDC